VSPYTEDLAVCRLAEATGLELSRRETIEITDQAAIKAAGMMRETPDYSRIRKAIQDGGEVPGAKVGGVEYILRRAGQ
jgi:hypothetical protein